MAVTGFWPVRDKLRAIIKYVENPEKTTVKEKSLQKVLHYTADEYKTEQMMYVSAINCPKQRACEYMNDTKKKFHKQGNVVAYHAIQSFVSGEVTAEEAHKIGLETAERMWGDDYEIVVTTHLNTQHIHNHIVINSVSFKTGKKFQNHIADHYKLREISDELCKEHKLNVLQPSKFTGSRKKKYWIHKKGGKTHRDILRADIERALCGCVHFKLFISRLKTMGYIYENGTLKAPEWKRPVRLVNLGYTPEKLQGIFKQNLRNNTWTPEPKRIRFCPLITLENQLEFKVEHCKDPIEVLVDLVFLIIMKLINLVRDSKEYLNGNQPMSPSIHRAFVIEKQINDEYYFLKNNDLHSVGDVLNYCKGCEAEISVLEQERQKIRNSNRRPKSQEERQAKNKAAREISKRIKPLRDKLKKAESVLTHYEYVWDLLKTERDLEEKALTKQRKRGYER